MYIRLTFLGRGGGIIVIVANGGGKMKKGRIRAYASSVLAVIPTVTLVFLMFLFCQFDVNLFLKDMLRLAIIPVVGTLFFVFPLLLLAGSAKKGLKKSKAENLRTAFLIGCVIYCVVPLLSLWFSKNFGELGLTYCAISLSPLLVSVPLAFSAFKKVLG